MTIGSPPQLKFLLVPLKAACLQYASIVPRSNADTILLSSTISAIVISSFDIRVFKACPDSSDLWSLALMLNKQWHVSPPALKAADPMGPQTYTLLVL